jgi:peptidyl-prolyl cis-trans isomerase A (cyclophilin A)
MIRAALVTVFLAAAPALLAQEGQEAKKPEEPKPATTQPATTQPAEAVMYAKMETTLGDIVLELDNAKAPISTKNFVDYVDAGFYNGTLFNRVMSNFMIQGGGYLPDWSQKKDGLRPPIKNEWKNGLKNKRGTIAMARTGIADSATAQFFINVVDNNGFDQPRDGAAYAVFGRVVAGMDTVDKIRDVETKADPSKLPSGEKAIPVTPIVIKTVKRLPAEEGKTLATKADAEAKAAADKQLQDCIAKAEQEAGKKVEKSASGLMWVILKEGTGPQPAATDTVEVHYTGTLLDGSKFDSSVDRGTPYSFSLKGGVIKGWLEGVALMKVGEKRKLIVPTDLAYGAETKPKIPANSTLVFDVELLNIKK